jgi:GNAT superfamily N-acetyltransferase
VLAGGHHPDLTGRRAGPGWHGYDRGARLRDLDPHGDRAALERLWVAALGGVWPLLPAGLDLVRDGVVAEDGGAPVGVVGVAVGDGGQGGVQLLLVDPDAQRQGWGRGCWRRGWSGWARSGP